MIHPHTSLQLVNKRIGYGVFATAFIPKGTIVYVKDQLEVEVTPERYALLDRKHRKIVNKYSYIDQHGVRIISWDIAKYVNHRCDCNTMSTGYGLEIALRDIQPGEEITDEYGMFNLDEEMPLSCGCAACRKKITPQDLDLYHPEWDEKVKDALQYLNTVKQPLMHYLDPETRNELKIYLARGTHYRSVYTLKHRPAGVLMRETV